MKNQELRKKILEIKNSKGIEYFPLGIESRITDFMHINMELKQIFNRKFELLWIEMVEKYGEAIEKNAPFQADRETHKRVLQTVLSDQLVLIYLGKIFQMARENTDDPLEDTIEYDERLGFFRLKSAEEVVDLIFYQITFTTTLIIEISQGKTENLNKIISEYENKYGLYPKELFKIAFRMQLANKGKRPKITDEDAIIFANKEGKFYDENLLENKNGKTSFLLNITKSYSNHHKSKLKKANQ